MKNKKIIFIIILIIVVALILGLYFGTRTNLKGDAIKFKKEYESLNNTKTESGKTIRSITIPSNNPIIYKTEDEVVEMINNKETFVVYFGFPNCPWCRSVLPNLLEAAKDLKLDKIYYVNVLDIRDKIEYKDGKLETTKRGSEGYYELLKLLDNVLSDYSITDDKGNEISAGEKRIYAPNVVGIVSGKAEKLTEGISKKQTDAYMKLTRVMNKESYNDFKCVIKCVQEEPKVCSSKAC